MPDQSLTKRRRKIALRPRLRALHRDVGYFAVGLTVIYAVSGLAVNHVGQWDPNFKQVDRTHQIATPLPSDDQTAARIVLETLAIEEKPSDVYAESEGHLDIVLESRTLHVTRDTGKVFEEGQEPRLFLRLANWLHLNRGKKAWTIVADAYAVFLLFLASSGLFMLPGRKGIKGRGALIATAGALVPIFYVTLSGGP